ncbi:membrane-like protein [Sphingobium sp. CAP-1]|uniref:membrane-like protein n=1 Tax=Sphingobium sp. CAP-1 TaxID=2676077 RepID=UPI0012BB236E|nr:membrane-like protein [Sphingobium sp. CAP-1]QGP79659.1 membrane-like protein [Sphingobium sp. CAP-1]
MKRARLVLPLLLCGCSGGGEPADNQAVPANTVLTPINDAVEMDAEPANAAPLSQSAPSKPLVSRETSPPQKQPADYRAIGTEPFWAVMLHGSIATLERPGKAPLHFSVSHSDDGRAIRYLGEGFAMTLTAGPCSDGMSDALWSDRVQVSFGEGALKGCGGEREEGDYAP